ncbi:MAG: putative zinc-binding metallopeptidase [Planctomycetes bacterium]|nr:putative zinc-binding metallopeptidase [Planctomycetota bacterium]
MSPDPDPETTTRTAPQEAIASSGPPWESASDAELLRWRICDLKVRIEGSPLEQRVNRLYEELASRGLAYRPTCYLSTEWLCPDRIPLIGIPFYLVHPRLVRLEKAIMLEAEGETEEECMKLLRHEAGHAFNYAYRLFRRSRWRELFGPISREYNPHHYHKRPYSRKYVLHLDDYYAQAHPDEDFAETFAVWLTPGSDWKAKYSGRAGALKKLEYVDHLMKETAAREPDVRGGTRHWSASRTRATLETYFRQKKREFAKAYTGFYDPVLLRLFTVENGGAKAHLFLARNRRYLAASLSRWAGVPKYSADHLIRRLSQRSREMSLSLRSPEPETLIAASICLTSLVLEAREHYERRLAGGSAP